MTMTLRAFQYNVNSLDGFWFTARHRLYRESCMLRCVHLTDFDFCFFRIVDLKFWHVDVL